MAMVHKFLTSSLFISQFSFRLILSGIETIGGIKMPKVRAGTPIKKVNIWEQILFKNKKPSHF